MHDITVFHQSGTRPFKQFFSKTTYNLYVLTSSCLDIPTQAHELMVMTIDHFFGNQQCCTGNYSGVDCMKF